MAYTINKFNGVPFITIEDGTVDATTDLKLVGKNYTGYGEIQNENFLWLLENFSGSVEPSNPVSGQIWYDSTTQKIKVYDGSVWKATGGAEISTSDPAGLAEGDLWWDTTTNQLKILNANSEWILIGPQRAGTGTTQQKSIELAETGTGTLYAVIATYIGDEIVAVTSKNRFVPATTQDVDNWVASEFTLIESGTTLRSVNSNGISQVDPTGETNYFFGTASASLALTDGTNIFNPNDFLQASETLSLLDSVTKFGDLGTTLGQDDDIIWDVRNGNLPSMKMANNWLSIRDSLDNERYVFTDQTIRPAVDNTQTLGTSNYRFNNVYATTFTGTATQANTLKEINSGQFRTASTSNTANTVAVRDGNGDLFARLFSGTATQARYADLAEKYSTSGDLLPGTAVTVCAHEDHEVEPAVAGSICIGVVSTDPAYMMNSEAEGQYIALKGRVPVRVKGPVKKGQAVYADKDGVCGTIAATAFVGVALETNLSDDEKLVECVLKV